MTWLLPRNCGWQWIRLDATSNVEQPNQQAPTRHRFRQIARCEGAAWLREVGGGADIWIVVDSHHARWARAVDVIVRLRPCPPWSLWLTATGMVALAATLYLFAPSPVPWSLAFGAIALGCLVWSGWRWTRDRSLTRLITVPSLGSNNGLAKPAFIDLCVDLGFHSNVVRAIHHGRPLSLSSAQTVWRFGKHWERAWFNADRPFRAALQWRGSDVRKPGGAGAHSHEFAFLHDTAAITAVTATDEGAVERDFELQLRPKEHLHESAVQRGTNWIARAVAAITQSAMQSLAAPHRIDSSSPHAYDVPTLKSLSLAYPANTSQAQRRHLNDSAQQALDSLGLTGVKLHLHAEPTAAVAELVGHALDSNGGDPISKKLAQGGAPAVCRIAVADFGAGTLDVALVVVEVHRQPGTNPSIALVTSFAAATPAAGDRLTALFSTVGAAQTGPRAAHQWFACEEPGKEGWMESLRKEGQSGNEKFHNVVAADRVDSGQSGLAIGLELIRGVARSYSPDVLVLGGRTGQSPIVQAVVRRALGDLARAVPIVAASEIVSNGDAASIDCGKSLVASGLGRAVAAHGGVHMTIHPAGNGAPWLAVAFPDPGSPTGFSRSAVDGHTLHEGLDPFPERGLEGNLSLNTAIAYIAYGFSGSRAGIPLWELRGPGGAAAWRAVVKGTGVFDLAVETEGGEVSCFAPAPADFHLYCQGRVSTSAACREHLLAARSQEPDNGRAT